MGAINVKHTGSGAAIALSSDGTSLLLDGTAIGGGGGGASAYTIDTKSAAYTVVAGDLGKIIFMSASGTVTLPDPAVVGSGFWVIVKVDNTRTSGNTLSRTGTGNIVGLTSYYLNPGMSINLISDGTNFITDTAFSHMLSYDTYGSKTQASATGNRSIALGDGATASNNYSSAIGKNAQATGVNSLAIGSTNSSTSATGSKSSAIGANSSAAGSQSSGSGSMALGGSYASGTDAFSAAITNNTSSYGATNTSSIAIGKQAKATGAYGTAIGEATQATASNSVCMGYYSQATGQGSLAFGYDTQATGLQSTAIGLAARNPINGSFKFAGGKHQTSGDSQTGIFPLLAETTDATATAMVTYHNNSATASTDNQVVLPNNSVYGFTGTIIARENSAQTNDFAVWEVKGGAVRATGVATTALGSYNINKISESTGAAAWAIAISADTTNGAIAFTVTGEAAHSIRWVATINTTEVTY